jgi:hypothetical protein
VCGIFDELPFAPAWRDKGPRISLEEHTHVNRNTRITRRIFTRIQRNGEAQRCALIRTG